MAFIFDIFFKTLVSIVTAIVAIVMFAIWQVLALLNFFISLISSFALAYYLITPFVGSNWEVSISHLFLIGINFQTWQIVSIHGWIYSFVSSVYLMRYFPLLGVANAAMPFAKVRSKQIIETKNIFISPPKIG